ncbi:HAD-IA family hydrolase [Paraferrimonas sedimenticola]|uniref:Haloacid dehalogenase n=1 Tax=Paraferrimonas sedimenticola TaxID=375674 RepID=A0AA37RZ29_9GAMM|nr:HAD-IA family hydrolase [Paraferrimonas sedimenticola]GLP97472.1 haloacid dehalogenase [Paraferrimonas sedimenticola]
MIRHYLRHGPIKAISFDLDDCLYDNRPPLKAALDELQGFLEGVDARFASWSYKDWFALKLACQRAAPQLNHSVSQTRLATLLLAFERYQIADAQALAERAMALFIKKRSELNVDAATKQLLSDLRKDYSLVAITNGNLDMDVSGLAECFDLTLQAEVGQRAKPHSCMFAKACEKLAILPSQLMHIGDHPRTDVGGARDFGAVSVWLNPGFGHEQPRALHRSLPHWQISELQELAQLVY